MTMAQLRTKAIVLSRTNYGEADRIMNLITPANGKVSVIAKGVRREKSKLAGGVELLAVTDLVLHKGRGELSIVTSARIEAFYSHILEDYDRLQFAYYVLKDISKAAELVPEPEFYDIAETALVSLNTLGISLALIETWYRLQMAILLGVGLNLATDEQGRKLSADATYRFSVDDMSFVQDPRGDMSADHIKLLRIASANNPEVINKVGGTDEILERCRRIAQIAHE